MRLIAQRYPVARAQLAKALRAARLAGHIGAGAGPDETGEDASRREPFRVPVRPTGALPAGPAQVTELISMV